MEPYLILIFGGLFTAILFFGGVFAVVASIRSKKKAEESGGWPSVIGVITNAYIKKNVSTDSEGYTSTTYTPQIEYQYSVMNQNFTSNRVSFGFTKSYSRKKKAEEALASYPINASNATVPPTATPAMIPFSICPVDTLRITNININVNNTSNMKARVNEPVGNVEPSVSWLGNKYSRSAAATIAPISWLII